MSVKSGKLVIVGAGKVGNAVLDSVLRLSIIDEIVVINRNRDKALGAVLDASHTTAFEYSTNTSIRVGDYPDCADAQIIVVTAGPSIVKGEYDRSILLKRNIEVMNGVMANITRYTREAILIIITNPLDIQTY